MNILEVGIQRSIETGISQGEQKKLVSLICKKMEKGYSVEEIADILEENIDVIRPIYEIAQQYKPDYDIEQICKKL